MNKYINFVRYVKWVEHEDSSLSNYEGRIKLILWNQMEIWRSFWDTKNYLLQEESDLFPTNADPHLLTIYDLWPHGVTVNSKLVFLDRSWPRWLCRWWAWLRCWPRRLCRWRWWERVVKMLANGISRWLLAGVFMLLCEWTNNREGMIDKWKYFCNICNLKWRSSRIILGVWK